MRTYARWFFLLLLVCEIILLCTGLVSPNIAVILIAITEGTALLLFLAIFVPVAIRVAKQVRTGERVVAAIQNQLAGFLPKPVLAILRFEIGLWAAFFRGIRNKKDVPGGSMSIDYGREFRMMCIVVACLTPVEIGAVELLCWHFGAPIGLRVAIWVATIYALLWIVGLALSLRVYPHYANSDELVLRYCWYHTIQVEAEQIERCVHEKRDCEKNKTIEYDGDLIALNVMRTTNVSLYFKRPYQLCIDGELTQNAISRLSFNADNPQSACKSINALLDESAQDAGINNNIPMPCSV
jgi:hypothetical protein